MKRSLRQAINAKCRECIYDPLGGGTAAQQITCCTLSDCPLYLVRPITATTLPVRLLDRFNVQISELCPRARGLVQKSDMCRGNGSNGPLPGTELISGGAS